MSSQCKSQSKWSYHFGKATAALLLVAFLGVTSPLLGTLFGTAGGGGGAMVALGMTGGAALVTQGALELGLGSGAGSLLAVGSLLAAGSLAAGALLGSLMVGAATAGVGSATGTAPASNLRLTIDNGLRILWVHLHTTCYDFIRMCSKDQ